MIRPATRKKALEAGEQDWKAGRIFSKIADQALYNEDGTEAVIYKTIWIGRSCYRAEVYPDGREPLVERVPQ